MRLQRVDDAREVAGGIPRASRSSGGAGPARTSSQASSPRIARAVSGSPSSETLRRELEQPGCDRAQARDEAVVEVERARDPERGLVLDAVEAGGGVLREAAAVAGRAAALSSG